MESANLETLIRNLGEKNFHFLVNNGNAGDGLIHAGFYQLAKRLGLTVEAFHYPEDRRGKNLLIMGAGAFCKAAWHKVDAVDYYSQRFENVYVLPATFETTFGPVNRMLRELPANVTIFCRERISYEAVRRLVPLPDKVFLDHDLAFEIDPAPWKKPGEGELNALRTDNESRLKRVPSSNFDISNMGREYHHTLLLDTLSAFATVNTDRLHAAIAGALLGKKVRLFEGNYHKIKAIYEYSLREKYPNVVLCGTDELRSLIAASDRGAFRRWLTFLILRLPFAGYLRKLKTRPGGWRENLPRVFNFPRTFIAGKGSV
jgi:hypothetical protein